MIVSSRFTRDPVLLGHFIDLRPSSARLRYRDMSSNARAPVPVRPAPPAPSSGILHVHGTSIIDQAGMPVILKGAGLGGYLNMENCAPRSVYSCFMPRFTGRLPGCLSRSWTFHELERVGLILAMLCR